MAYLGIKPSGAIPRINSSHPYAQGMVAFFVFHEGGGSTVTDFVSGIVGSFVNGPTWVQERNQNGGHSLSFSAASSQYVDLGNPSQLDMNAAGSMAVCASYYHPTKPNYTNFVIASKGSSWVLDVEGPSNSGRFYINSGGGGGLYAEGRSVVDGDNRVVGGGWDDVNKFGYVAAEGRLANSGNGPFASIPASATSTRIGINGSGSGAFNGHINWVVIWNRFVPPSVMAEFQLQPFALLEPIKSYFLVSAAGAPATQTINANLLGSTSQLFNATVTPGAVNVSANLIASTSQFFNAAVTSSQTISANLLTSTAQFFNATVSPGAVNISANLVPSGATFFNATVSNGGTINTNLIASTAQFFNATVTATATISANLLASTAQFYSATVSNGGTIVANQIGSTAQFFNATVTPGAVNVSANLLSSGATIYDHTVTLGGGAPQTITANLISSTAQFYNATVTPGAVNISPNPIASGAQIFSHVVGNAGTISASLIPSGVQFYNATVSSGAVNIAASLIPSGSQVFSHTIFSGTAITPQFISSGASFPLAAVTVGPVSIVGASPFSSTQFPLARVSGGEVFYSPGLLWTVGDGQKLHWEVDENGRVTRPY